MSTMKKHKKVKPDQKNSQKKTASPDSQEMSEIIFKPINVTYEQDITKEETVIFRIDKGVKLFLVQLAKSKGLTTASLLRMWVMEKYNEIHHFD